MSEPFGVPCALRTDSRYVCQWTVNLRARLLQPVLQSVVRVGLARVYLYGDSTQCWNPGCKIVQDALRPYPVVGRPKVGQREVIRRNHGFGRQQTVFGAQNVPGNTGPLRVGPSERHSGESYRSLAALGAPRLDFTHPTKISFVNAPFGDGISLVYMRMISSKPCSLRYSNYSKRA